MEFAALTAKVPAIFFSELMEFSRGSFRCGIFYVNTNDLPHRRMVPLENCIKSIDEISSFASSYLVLVTNLTTGHADKTVTDRTCYFFNGRLFNIFLLCSN